MAHRQSHGRQPARDDKRACRALTDRIDLEALRAARERATLETAPMRNMPTDAWERQQWGLCD